MATVSNRDKDTILRQIERQVAARQARLYTRQMAAALCVSYQIPDNGDLVPFFTAIPGIKTNREAVACWIEEQMADPNLAISEAVLPVLIDMLGRKLRLILEGAQ